MNARILVSDFDGTMTANDFYKLVAARLLPSDALAPWSEYRAGNITHFEALRRIFAQIRASTATVTALVDEMAPDPLLAQDVRRLKENGWEVVVASAGCAWYIDKVLRQAGLTVGPGRDLMVHANPGVYSPEKGLCMRPPENSSFFSPDTGVDKAAIVRFHQRRGAVVAFAGDGFADVEAALEAAPDLRFARADLASALAEAGAAHHPFSRWADVAEALLQCRRHA